MPTSRFVTKSESEKPKRTKQRFVKPVVASLHSSKNRGERTIKEPSRKANLRRFVKLVDSLHSNYVLRIFYTS
jgi:hypothetical protein